MCCRTEFTFKGKKRKTTTKQKLALRKHGHPGESLGLQGNVAQARPRGGRHVCTPRVPLHHPGLQGFAFNQQRSLTRPPRPKVQAGRSEKSRRSGKRKEPSPSSYSKPGRHVVTVTQHSCRPQKGDTQGLTCGQDRRAEGHRAQIPEPPSSLPAHFLPLPHPHNTRTHSHEHPGASARQAQECTGGDPQAHSTRTLGYGLGSPCHQGC